MTYLWKAWNAFEKKFMLKKKKLVFLDFDGTLVSIARTPSEVHLNPETEKILRTLCDTPGVYVVVVSGRPLAEISAYLKLKNLILAGNHGLEIRGRGFQLPLRAKKAKRLKNFIKMLAQKFSMAFNFYPGIFVENKNFTLSIHYRNLSKDQMPIFMQFVRFFRQKYHHYPALWTQGKKVIEICPGICWGKADTVAYLIQKFHGVLPIAIGDDRADEDMFRIVKKAKGVAIRVGRLKSSAANFYLRSPEDVGLFLKQLCRRTGPRAVISS